MDVSGKSWWVGLSVNCECGSKLKLSALDKPHQTGGKSWECEDIECPSCGRMVILRERRTLFGTGPWKYLAIKGQ